MILHLNPLIWTQEIRHYPNNDGIGDDEGGYLTTTCVPHARCDLRLRNGANLRDFEIELSILRGEIDSDRRLEFRLLEDAIGGIYFIVDQNFVHGWFHLRPKNYTALWDQVLDGRYEDCALFLGVEPVEDDICGNPLSIVSASLRFQRKPIADKSADQQASRKGLFARR
jgi:hypothetical protein